MSTSASDPHPSLQAEGLFTDWLARRDSPEPFDFEELCQAHPGLAPELKQLYSDWQRIDALMRKAGLGVSSSLGESLARRLAEEFGSGLDPQVSLHAEEEKSSGPPTNQLFERLRQHTLKTSRYKLHGELARGGMGAILEVWDEDLRRNLAMKVILGKAESAVSGGTPPVDKRLLARFLEEAQVTGQLDHPGIVPVHELGLDAEGRVYFTMKLVKGRDLKQVFDLVFEEREGWNETRALGVILKVCEAMAFAHSKGVVHRDLKPANVMVGKFGEVYVMDWGLARVLGRKDAHDLRLQDAGSQPTSVKTERRAERAEAPDSPLFTMDGDIVGTPAYMPPEQALGQLERLAAHSDVYAIGAMLYHLLARRMPYVPKDGRVSNRTVLALVVQGAPAPLATLRKDIPAELVAIVEHAMAREPERRYRDTLELAEDLRAYLEHRVVKAYETGALAELRKWVERNKALATSAAAAVLLLIAGLTTSLVFKARADRNATLARESADEAGKQAKLARTNEERALAGEAIAKNEKERADREADTAKKNEQVATARADEVLRLSAFQRLVDLETEADRLWPADPDNLPKYDRWLGRARELVAGLDPRGGDAGHRAQLAKLRERAVPLTEEERVARRSAHPRFGELAPLAKKLAALRAARDVRDGKARPTAFALDASLHPSDADGLNGLARPLVDPARTEFGREAEGLALARLAIEKVENDESAARAGDTLAWALFANGLDDEALQESAAALEAAPAERRNEYERRAGELRTAVDDARSGPVLRAAESELAALEAEISSVGLFHFADEQDTWWHNQLQKLVAEIEAFADPKSGLIAGISPEHGSGIEQRRDFAATVAERSVMGEAAQPLWSAALASIANPNECPLYAGLRISPQLGLLPIGRDPDSGLWEFADLQTGDAPRRGADGKLVLTEGMGVVFVLLPGGTFQMGAQKTDPNGPNYDPQAGSDEGPVHEVTLSPFFLSKYEMTQGQWERFTGRNPSNYGPNRYSTSWNRDRKVWSGLHPVEQVSWPTCVETLGRLGLALPSEAQWEYGCRAGSSRVFWCGNEKESLHGVANLSDAYGKSHGNEDWGEWEPGLDDGQTVHAEVGRYRANAFGLHDVHGNVWEWCMDGYDEGFYRASPLVNPVAPWAASSLRVRRGGGFGDAAVIARSAYRLGVSPERADYFLGLRPARTIAP